jgi:hypothetical protein
MHPNNCILVVLLYRFLFRINCPYIGLYNQLNSSFGWIHQSVSNIIMFTLLYVFDVFYFSNVQDVKSSKLFAV